MKNCWRVENVLTRNRFSIKLCFHLGLRAPAISLTSTGKLLLSLFHWHTLTVKPEESTLAEQRNVGKHVAFNLSVEVTARPSETWERMHIVKMIRADSPLPPETGNQVADCSKPPMNINPSLLTAFKHTVGTEQD